MDWKQEAEDKLRGYEARKRALLNIPEELARLESEAVSIHSAPWEGTPVKGGSCTREDLLLTNLVHQAELVRARERAVHWISEVDRSLEHLDAEERLSLNRFYIRPAKGNVDRLCEELGVEKTAVYDRRYKALRHFTVAMYGSVES